MVLFYIKNELFYLYPAVLPCLFNEPKYKEKMPVGREWQIEVFITNFTNFTVCVSV